MNKGLIIFARKPVPGRVKTRLAQDVGDQAAADLYAAMLDDVLENAAKLDGIRTMAFWATDGDANLPLPAAQVESFVQSGMDLGARMAAAFEYAFDSGMEVCCIIGTDSPDLPAEYIRKAFDHLDNDEADAVFGPAEDGGYYLLGLKQCWPGFFQDIPWSTEVVLETSLKRAGELGLRTALLPIWYDLDEMKDLRRLLDSPEASAPRTREAAHKLLQGRMGLEPPITLKKTGKHSMKPILIIAAVPQETILLEHALGTTSRMKTVAYQYVEGALGKQHIIICAAGIGKINAAAATAALIERHRPKLVINTGCAGAYPGSGLSIGDLAVASEELLGDEGVLTSEGWQDLRSMELPYLVQDDRRYYNNIPLSKHAAEKAMQLADCYGVSLARGRFITVSTCSGTRQRGEDLVRHFGAITENMEGGAVALTCLRYGINCLEIRGISNQVDERDMNMWDIPLAVEAAQRFVLKYLEEMGRPEQKESPHQTVTEL